MIALLSMAWGLEGGAAAGLSLVTNDPFQRVAGLEVSTFLAPTERFAVEGRIAAHPLVGKPGWRPLTHQLVEVVHVSPDISQPLFRGELTASFVPLQVLQGVWNARLGAFAGGGVISTRDDLEAIQAQGSAGYEAAQNELHPTYVLGLSVDAVRKSVGVRVRGQRVHYVENIGPDVREKKQPHMVAVELIVRR